MLYALEAAMQVTASKCPWRVCFNWSCTGERSFDPAFLSSQTHTICRTKRGPVRVRVKAEEQEASIGQQYDSEHVGW